MQRGRCILVVLCFCVLPCVQSEDADEGCHGTAGQGKDCQCSLAGVLGKAEMHGYDIMLTFEEYGCCDTPISPPSEV